MRKRLMLFTLAALICTLSSNAMAFPPAYTGKIIVESKHVNAGETFTVKVWMDNNNSAIAGLSIPLKYDKTYLTCSYIDFTGSLRANGMDPYTVIEPGQLTLSYLPPGTFPFATIKADSGLIATLYFTVSPETPDMVLYIDSLNHDSAFESNGTILHIWRRVEMADTLGETIILPGSEAGRIFVGNATGIEDGNNAIMPSKIELQQNFPNPFNPTTMISFSLPEKSKVSLEIFNLLGQKVAGLGEGSEFPAGTHTLAWNATEFPSGVYFYRLATGNQSLTKKMLLMK